MASAETRVGIKIAAFAVVAGVGLAACGSEVGGQALPEASASVSTGSEVPATSAVTTPDVPPTMTENLVNAPGEQPFDLTLNSYAGGGVGVDRTNEYEYGDTVMKDADGSLKMWFCGGGGTGVHHGDSIWYSFNQQGTMMSGWSAPVEVVRSSDNPADSDYAHNCDPSVVQKDGMDYVAYTGATDWTPNGGSCDGSPTADGCDNRIFMARVPDSTAGDPQSYQKLVDVGSCDDPGCFQWRPFRQGTEYPPVPIISNDPEVAWQRAGTSAVGAVAQQTHEYGVGQPSMVITGSTLTMWYTDITGQSAGEDVAVLPLADLGNPAAMVDKDAYVKQLSDANSVNYDVAFDAAIGRFVATTSAEYPGNPTTPLGRIRVAPAQKPGDNVLGMSAPVISSDLTNDADPTFVGDILDTFNSGFLRDPDGNLASVPAQPGGPLLDWVGAGDHRNDIANSGIVFEPFTVIAP